MYACETKYHPPIHAFRKASKYLQNLIEDYLPCRQSKEATYIPSAISPPTS
jgi:hypothetical protein